MKKPIQRAEWDYSKSIITAAFDRQFVIPVPFVQY